MSDQDPRIIYADIIDLPHHRSSDRKHMSLYERAAQFAPFAALSGYDDMVREEARLTDEKTGLSEHETDQLNRKLGYINDLIDDGYTPEITVTYFVPDRYKSGGSYRSITALVKAVDAALHQLILYGSYDIENRKVDPVIIQFDRLKSISGELFDFMES